MSGPIPEFHPLAIKEARKARRWYATRSIGAANRFMTEIDLAIQRITDGPKQWPPYLHGTRVYPLQHFPYLIVYTELPDRVQVIAVAHGKRRPGYWKKRTR